MKGRTDGRKEGEKARRKGGKGIEGRECKEAKRRGGGHPFVLPSFCPSIPPSHPPFLPSFLLSSIHSFSGGKAKGQILLYRAVLPEQRSPSLFAFPCCSVGGGRVETNVDPSNHPTSLENRVGPTIIHHGSFSFHTFSAVRHLHHSTLTFPPFPPPTPVCRCEFYGDADNIG
jgi:hypothetical protein